MTQKQNALLQAALAAPGKTPTLTARIIGGGIVAAGFIVTTIVLFSI